MVNLKNFPSEITTWMDAHNHHVHTNMVPEVLSDTKTEEGELRTGKEEVKLKILRKHASVLLLDIGSPQTIRLYFSLSAKIRKLKNF